MIPHHAILVFLLVLISPNRANNITEDIENLLILKMNLSVDPCSDFYEYSCGGWMQENNNTDERHTPFEALLTSNIQRLKETLEIDAVFNSTAHEKVRKLYRTCIDPSSQDRKHLVESIKAIGEFPRIAPIDDFDLTSLSLKLSRRAHFIIYFAPMSNLSQPEILLPTMHIKAPEAIASSLYRYFHDADRHPREMAAYREYITDMMELMANETSSNVTAAEISTASNDVFEFILQLFKHGKVSKSSHATLSEVMGNFTVIDWDRYIAAKVPSGYRTHFYNDTVMQVFNMTALRAASELIEETKPQTLWNFAILKHSETFSTVDDHEIRNIRLKLYKAIHTSIEESRTVRCIYYCLKQLPHASGSLFASFHSSREDKANVEVMARELKKAASAMFDGAKWMDETTREQAKLKLRELLFFVGYREWIGDEPKLDAFHDQLLFGHNSTLIEILDSIHKWKKLKDYHLLGVEQQRWKLQSEISVMYPNAVNSRRFNIFDVFVGILQPPFYYSHLPNAINYGAIGSIIGHEITHAFDPKGSLVWHNGTLANWWTNETRAEYDSRVQCVKEQYGNETFDAANMTLNGEFTKEENVADIGGVKASFLAYQQFVADFGAEKEYLEYFTNNQLFFISYAQNWCATGSAEVWRRAIQRDPHSPGRFRTIIPLRNLPQFAETFNCPAGSPMNDGQQCEVW